MKEIYEIFQKKKKKIFQNFQFQIQWVFSNTLVIKKTI